LSGEVFYFEPPCTQVNVGEISILNSKQLLRKLLKI